MDELVLDSQLEMANYLIEVTTLDSGGNNKGTLVAHLIQNGPEKIIWAQNRKRKAQEQIEPNSKFRLTNSDKN
jgi:hypothetical protein